MEPENSNTTTIQQLKQEKIEQMANNINTRLSNNIAQLEKTQTDLGQTIASLKAVSDEISTLYEVADRLVK